MHRVALVIDPSPALLPPLVRGLGAAGYDVAFSAPRGAVRGVSEQLRGSGRRGLALDRSMEPDEVVGRVRDELGRLDLVVVEPARAEEAPELHGSSGGGEVYASGASAIGAAQITLELLGETHGSIVRLLRPASASDAAALSGHDVASTRRLGRSLGARVRVNGVAIPRSTKAGVATDRTADAVVRAVLWLAGSDLLNGEIVSIDR